MKRQLALKQTAPDEVEIAVGEDFKKHFKRAEEPFKVTDEHAEMLLNTTDYFKEMPVEARKDEAKEAKNDDAKKGESREKGKTAEAEEKSVPKK